MLQRTRPAEQRAHSRVGSKHNAVAPVLGAQVLEPRELEPREAEPDEPTWEDFAQQAHDNTSVTLLAQAWNKHIQAYLPRVGLLAPGPEHSSAQRPPK